MCGFTVIAERLTVIGRHDDERAIHLAAVAQLLQCCAQRRVGPGYFGVVRSTAPGERVRSLVGRVRIEKVYPREPGTCLTGLWPRDPVRRGPQDVIR